MGIEKREPMTVYEIRKMNEELKEMTKERMRGMKEMNPNGRILPLKLYKHFKGQIYKVLGFAEDSESGDIMVVYRAEYEPFKTYVRSLSMFESLVDTEKYPEATQKYRFKQIEEESEYEK